MLVMVLLVGHGLIVKRTTGIRMDAENPSQRPSAAYDPNYRYESTEDTIETVKKESGIPQTLLSFIVGVLFGVVAPLFLNTFFSSVVELFIPDSPLPVQGEIPEDYQGVIDFNSSNNVITQLTEKLALYSTLLWFMALAYLFPIVYQLRIAIIYGKILQVFCLALTILGPPAVLIILPLWGQVIS